MAELMSNRVTVLKNDYGHLQYEIFNDAYFIHLELYKWSKELYKKYMVMFEEWLLGLSDSGVNSVFVLISDNDKKLYKFEQMFGFEEIHREGGAIIMARPTRRV